jgi:CSLREA domain-containing protein
MKHVTLRAPGRHRRAGQLLLWTLMVVAGAALLTSCQTARVITVSTFLDGSDANTADGVCEMTSGLGDCSLRAAVDEANATSGPV